MCTDHIFRLSQAIFWLANEPPPQTLEKEQVWIKSICTPKQVISSSIYQILQKKVMRMSLINWEIWSYSVSYSQLCYILNMLHCMKSESDSEIRCTQSLILINIWLRSYSAVYYWNNTPQRNPSIHTVWSLMCHYLLPISPSLPDFSLIFLPPLLGTRGH